MTWTHFWDMHSGGVSKLDWEHIYIEAPEEEAIQIFYNRFGRNPHRVTCTCCGPDYSISEHECVRQATGYGRACAFKDGKYVEEPKEQMYSHEKYMEFEEYRNSEGVLVIYADQIGKHEREGYVPEEGYVWR